MKGYMIVQLDITDSDTFDDYGAPVGETVEKYGGRLLVRAQPEIIEGEWPYPVVVVSEFPSLEKLKDWYDSPEYSEIKPIRQRSAKVNIVFAEGD